LRSSIFKKVADLRLRKRFLQVAELRLRTQKKVALAHLWVLAGSVDRLRRAWRNPNIVLVRVSLWYYLGLWTDLGRTGASLSYSWKARLWLV
jgi:hypothetical protein